MIRSIIIYLITALSGTLSVLFGWWKPAYALISRFIWSPGLLKTANVKLTVEGTDKVKTLPPCIFYANHRSFYDIPVMMRGIPRPLYFLAKKELKKIPFLGWGMSAIGMIFIDRSNRTAAIESMKKAGNQIKRGKSIVTFPEGTRTSSKEMIAFKKGAFHLAKSQGIPLVPVAIIGTEKVLPKHGKLRSGKVKMVVGDPINTAEIEEMNLESLRDYSKSKLTELLEKTESTKFV